MDLELSCHETHRLLAGDNPPRLLDCRETDEHALVHIAGATLMPMSELASRVGELQDLRDEHLVVYCHHGARSAQVASWLRGQGFESVQSMAGGIDRWAVEIEPGMARY